MKFFSPQPTVAKCPWPYCVLGFFSFTFQGPFWILTSTEQMAPLRSANLNKHVQQRLVGIVNEKGEF